MNGKYQAIWLEENGDLTVLDQRTLPFEKTTVTLKTAEEATAAIADMTIRGAGTIGSVAAFGVYLAARQVEGDLEKMRPLAAMIRESRPTAVNLMWAVDRMMNHLENAAGDRVVAAKAEAIRINDEDVLRTKAIGEHGCDIFERLMEAKGIKEINVLTHCNAGWLAIIDHGTALAPMYEAKRRGIPVHVWVDETRPRNQGASLTSWELKQAGIPHTIIADNTGGHLMQQGMVDLCITGADRVSRQGDVANKIGTYLKALAAKDNDVPFYVALPASTFDFSIVDGVKEIPIEERSEDEVHWMRGTDETGAVRTVKVTPEGTKALNIGFDVTPNRLITGLITERGVTPATLEAVEAAFKDLL